MDEDINPLFPELEGEWVKKERLDELQRKLDIAVEALEKISSRVQECWESSIDQKDAIQALKKLEE